MDWDKLKEACVEYVAREIARPRAFGGTFEETSASWRKEQVAAEDEAITAIKAMDNLELLSLIGSVIEYRL